MKERYSPDLHDARIDGVDINARAGIVILKLQYYEFSSSPRRVDGRITFSRVEHIAQNFNINEINRNRSAGNVSYWIPSSEFGPTHIYLAHGYIFIVSDPPIVEREIELSD